jgi:hypothetical protein
MSTFDPDSFRNEQFDGGIDTRSIPHPAGDDFIGHIGTETDDIKFRTTSGGSTILEVQVYTDDPQVCDVTNRNPTKVRWSGFLDINDSGGLDFSAGKNRRLGSLLTALGFQNLDGSNSKPWRFTDFHGMPLRYSVNHRTAPDGSGNVYDEVGKVARA